MQQLERICSSTEFQRKRKLCNLLEYIVNKSIAGKKDQLKGYVIGVEVFNRDKDFSPELDSIVRIQAGRLRRSLENYYLNEGKRDSIYISIPKGRYTPIFLPQEYTQFQSSEIQEEFEKTDLTSAEIPTIAVLPFTNLTGDADKEHYAQGLAEELSIQLSKYEDFRIIRPFLPISDINNIEFLEKLNVNFIIEGSIRMITEELKISISLIDNFTREQIWAEQYKRKLISYNLIELQENVAQQVARVIANEYGIIFQKLFNESRLKAPKELNTYEAMLKFYNHEVYLSEDSFESAITSLQEATKKEPNFAPTLSMLSSLYLECYALDYQLIENQLEKGSELIEKAIKLDPQHQLTQIVYSFLQFLRDDKPSFLNATENALNLNPNPNIRLASIGFHLCLFGEWERGKSMLDTVIKFNPTIPKWCYGALTCYYYRKKEYKLAYEESRKYKMKNIFWGPMLRAACLGQLERVEETKEDLNDLMNIRPDFREKGKYLISLFVKEEELIDHIIEGLQKAGLDI